MVSICVGQLQTPEYRAKQCTKDSMPFVQLFGSTTALLLFLVGYSTYTCMIPLVYSESALAIGSYRYTFCCEPNIPLQSAAVRVSPW